jgi:hypothetical protein
MQLSHKDMKKNKNSEIIFVVGLTGTISKELGISSQTVRDVLNGKSVGKYYDKIMALRKDFLKQKGKGARKITNKPPRHGFINELAKLCECSRHTVRTAVYENAQGAKADRVRKVYNAKYKRK